MEAIASRLEDIATSNKKLLGWRRVIMFYQYWCSKLRVVGSVATREQGHTTANANRINCVPARLCLDLRSLLTGRFQMMTSSQLDIFLALKGTFGASRPISGRFSCKGSLFAFDHWRSVNQVARHEHGFLA